MFKPLEVFNDIVNGLILGIYDLVISLVAPLLAPLLRRSYHLWKFLYSVEGRLSSLTLMFLLMSGIVATKAPGFLSQIADDPTVIIEQKVRGIAYVVVTSVVLTMFFDLILRLLIYARSLAIGVVFSRVRLLSLRLYFCTGLLSVLVVDWATLPPLKTLNDSEFFWSEQLSLLPVFLASLPFSGAVLHLTHRLRGWPKWFFAVPFAYSFANLALLAGLYIGVFFLGLFSFGINIEQPRLYAFNTRCRMADAGTVAVESALLLDTKWFDAATLTNIFANVGNQIIELEPADDKSVILLKGKLIQANWFGKLLKGVEKPNLTDKPAVCSLETYGIFWKEPERVKIMEDG